MHVLHVLHVPPSTDLNTSGVMRPALNNIPTHVHPKTVHGTNGWFAVEARFFQ